MIRVSIAVVVALLLPSSARAEGDDDEAEKASAKQAPPDDDEPPGDAKKKPPAPAAKASMSVSTSDLVETSGPKGRMTLPGGTFMLSAIVETNLAKQQAGKPISIAPDLWLGLADRLTVGLYHSGRAETGFLSGFGNGLCFRNDLCKVGLGEKYTFAGGEARIGLTEGAFATALVLGGNAHFIKPDKFFKGKAGILARIHTRKVAVELSPMVFIGLNKRKVMGVDVNKDVVAVPLTIFLRFAPRFALALQAGVTFDMKKAGDTYRVPAAAGISWWVTPHFAIDAAFGLGAVADKDDMTKAFDQRSATAGLSYAL
jgi:hypothetical protein